MQRCLKKIKIIVLIISKPLPSKNSKKKFLHYLAHTEPVAYLGFHFGGGGGVQNFSGNVGVFAWRGHAFARGVRGHAPLRKFLKMVQFGAF